MVRDCFGFLDNRVSKNGDSIRFQKERGNLGMKVGRQIDSHLFQTVQVGSFLQMSKECLGNF